MPAALKATQLGLVPHYKVRVVFQGAILHLASRTEPEPITDHLSGRLVAVALDRIDDPLYGDSAGFIEWSTVSAVSWRWSECLPAQRP